MSFKRKQAQEKSASLTMANRAFNPALAADTSELHYATIDDSHVKKKKRPDDGSWKSKDAYDYVAARDIDTPAPGLMLNELAPTSRKKSCAVYESAGEVKVAGRRATDDTSCFIILFVVAFLLAAICLIVALLAVLRVTEQKNNGGHCTACKQFMMVSPHEAMRLQSLEGQLITGVVNDRLENASRLEAELAARQPLSGAPGPPGGPGGKGPVGPRGVNGGVDLSLCRYRSATSTTPLITPYSQTNISTVKVYAEQGYTFTSVHCSNRGAEVYSLFSGTANSTQYYYCTCAGRAKTESLQPVAPRNLIECVIHWWQCPHA